MMDKEEQVIERGCWRITSDGSELHLWQQLKPLPEYRYDDLWTVGDGFSQTSAADLAYVAAKAARLPNAHVQVRDQADVIIEYNGFYARHFPNGEEWVFESVNVPAFGIPDDEIAALASVAVQAALRKG
jgi:hypothetical protein